MVRARRGGSRDHVRVAPPQRQRDDGIRPQGKCHSGAFGPGGSHKVNIGEGEYFKVPKNTVHHEGNTSPEVGEVVISRVGEGRLTCFPSTGQDFDLTHLLRLPRPRSGRRLAESQRGPRRRDRGHMRCVTTCRPHADGCTWTGSPCAGLSELSAVGGSISLCCLHWRKGLRMKRLMLAVAGAVLASGVVVPGCDGGPASPEALPAADLAVLCEGLYGEISIPRRGSRWRHASGTWR